MSDGRPTSTPADLDRTATGGRLSHLVFGTRTDSPVTDEVPTTRLTRRVRVLLGALALYGFTLAARRAFPHWSPGPQTVVAVAAYVLVAVCVIDPICGAIARWQQRRRTQEAVDEP